MPENAIICPGCRIQIPLTEAISLQIKESARKELEAEAQKQRGELAKKEQALLARARELEDAKRGVEAQIQQKLAAERERLFKEARLQTEQEKGLEIKDLTRRLEEQQRKLGEAQAQELQLRHQRRELEERQKAMELEIARRLDSERTRIAEETAKRFGDEHHRKELEKEKVISDLRRQIEDLKRVAEQGSQQNQGEVIELELETALRTQFPLDTIEPVAKGVRGADIVQKVHTKQGQYCGTIIWESKHTKAWSDGWVEKLKDDQRAVKADVAVLLSTVLPKDVSHFGHYQGIWVTTSDCSMSLALALRASLLQVAAARWVSEGRHEKMEAVYNYLTGIEFKQRVEAVVETFVSMRQQLDQERRAMTKIWAQREKQIERVTGNMIGLHGDLKGIVGSTLPQIKSFELEALPEPDDEAEQAEGPVSARSTSARAATTAPAGRDASRSELF